MKTEKIKMTKPGDKDYPKGLLNIEKKPAVLYYIGNLPRADVPAVAMVGARACSGYGRRFARKISKELSDEGVQVISGMARGIDTQSQQGALEGATPTFAILGCGVDVCYPEENQKLYESILEQGGGIISEYPPGDQPLPWHFPQRNRIISGLSDVIVIVEAKQKSGSLITVEWALEQGKDVMAFPGRLDDPLSEGCNRLIKAGAGIVTGVEDILEVLQWEWKCGGRVEKSLDSDLEKIWQSLGSEMKTLEEIVNDTKLEYEVVLAGLIRLQMREYVEQPIEHYYIKK